MPDLSAQTPLPTAAPKRPSLAWQCGMACGMGVLALVLLGMTWYWPVDRSLPGPRWWPSICGLGLLLCAAALMRQVRTGGWSQLAVLSGRAGLQLAPWLWVSAAVGSVVLCMPWLGAVGSGALCYALALQGLRQASARTRKGLRYLLLDAVVGLLWSGLLYSVMHWGMGLHLPAALPWSWGRQA